MLRVILIQLLQITLFVILPGQSILIDCHGQDLNPMLQYTISMKEASKHIFHIDLTCKNINEDTIEFNMPQWMPGYYQIMNYSEEVRNFSVSILNSKSVPVTKPNKYTWQIIPGKISSFNVSYDVYAERKFVANNFLDTTHGYIIPAATFVYIKGHLNSRISLKVIPFDSWNNIATGLDRIPGKKNEFTANDFDILYDCPILIGNLDELPSFTVNGIVHRFTAYNPGTFNRVLFISGLEKTIRAGINVIGDIPYNEYTFIGIGPGYGGIEHLDNATVSFKGAGLEKPGAMSRMLKFLGHEYFHNYNVKRIRPFELGPFDYEKENKTNLLWVSEGLTVYYEYLIVKRAGLMSDDELLTSIESNINTIENDAGRHYQSLSQSSYETWDDGLFGNKPGETDKSISYYEKGPLIGMILDFSIRNATENKKSLDDVMRFLYWQYYKKLQRGFTDSEFQQACEAVAGRSLSREFEYVNTTKEIDYATYLSYPGLKISEGVDKISGKRKFTLIRQENMNPLQLSIYKSWSGN